MKSLNVFDERTKRRNVKEETEKWTQQTPLTDDEETEERKRRLFLFDPPTSFSCTERIPTFIKTLNFSPAKHHQENGEIKPRIPPEIWKLRHIRVPVPTLLHGNLFFNPAPPPPHRHWQLHRRTQQQGRHRLLRRRRPSNQDPPQPLLRPPLPTHQAHVPPQLPHIPGSPRLLRRIPPSLGSSRQFDSTPLGSQQQQNQRVLRPINILRLERGRASENWDIQHRHHLYHLGRGEGCCWNPADCPR